MLWSISQAYCTVGVAVNYSTENYALNLEDEKRRCQYAEAKAENQQAYRKLSDESQILSSLREIFQSRDKGMNKRRVRPTNSTR